MELESGSQTLERVLASYGLGRKIRQLRLRKKLSLADLGKHTGLSASLLSQLENERIIPTLPTLARIALVFNVTLDYFFTDPRAQKLFSIIRASERIRFPESEEARFPSYFFECLAFATQGKGLNAYLADFPPRPSDADSEHFHEGAEFLFIIEGALTVCVSGNDHTLNAGDSLHMDASEPHSYRGAGEKGARAIVITVPPRL